MYATRYPQVVNGTCHSLHMPSHLWDRMGVFALGESSNRQSVAGADTFAHSGALDDSGGSGLSGQEFAFNAGRAKSSTALPDRAGQGVGMGHERGMDVAWHGQRQSD